MLSFTTPKRPILTLKKRKEKKEMNRSEKCGRKTKWRTKGKERHGGGRVGR